MTNHEHRPAYLNFMNTKRICRCRHCQQPLRCSNRWLYSVSMLPALLTAVAIALTGLEKWPVLLVVLAADAALQYLAFRRLKFKIDLVVQRDDMQHTLQR